MLSSAFTFLALFRDDLAVMRGVKCQDNLRIQSELQFFPLEEKLWKKIFTGYSRRELKVEFDIQQRLSSSLIVVEFDEKIEKIHCLTFVE